MAFLERDPNNTTLLNDAASAAFDEQAFDLAADLIDRRGTLAALTPAMANLKGMVAMARQDYADAAEVFTQLRASGQDHPGLRFNLAWAKAMTNAWDEALDLLDNETVAASPRAPSLKVQALHHLNRYDEGLACGEALLALFPANDALAGALATLALDAEKMDLARSYAARAVASGEGRAALGILTLGEQQAEQSLSLFDEALALEPHNPRAWVGKGLALQIQGDAAAGAEAIDRGAELFETHLGSWIAAGWAHFTLGDYPKARARFERAMAIDSNFSENHGGLAVLAIVEGNMAEAQREAEIALRLDKKSMGGALAKSMLLERQGDARSAQRIRDIALSMPVGPGGQTIAQALVGFGAGMRKK
jgi:tetratricopeptide (TPR) repeat protein